MLFSGKDLSARSCWCGALRLASPLDVNAATAYQLAIAGARGRRMSDVNKAAIQYLKAYGATAISVVCAGSSSPPLQAARRYGLVRSSARARPTPAESRPISRRAWRRKPAYQIGSIPALFAFAETLKPA